MKNNDNSWETLKNSLTKRLREPWQEPAFVFYFFGIICVAGGLGVWLPILIDVSKGSENLPGNLATYFVALLTTGCADILLTTDPNSEFKIKQRAFASLAVFVLILGIITSLCSLLLSKNWWVAFILSGLGSLVSLFIWCIANADNTKLFGDNMTPTTPLGGDTSEPTIGDLTSFTS